MKGTYLLIVELEKSKQIEVGSLGKINFDSGQYCYVGSGMNNMKKRIQRHLTNDKKTHWHIDYLLEKGKVKKVYYKDNNRKEECKIAREISNLDDTKTVDKFGCSDCNCNSHLFKIDRDVKNHLGIDWKEYKAEKRN